ncbi:uncharacterized protein LOC128858736 [Anastrepha ludens]|uniref:uncharacterized protein LOC128858736 n=1 Tax=Anastrepha ludens TaxID=28586 RepID=UPI0023AFA33D|nr:uncharacterized protein LOC128858736 [Anastrepha ludens]
MPKVYKQNFRDAWLQDEEFKQWIRKDCTDPTRAYCAYCKSSIGAKLFDIRHHAASKKHVAVMGACTQKNKLHFVPKSTKTQEQEAALCLHIAKHSAIATSDHLSKLCVEQFSACKAAANIKLGRTKCTYIIKNVLAMHFISDLRSDIGDSGFSLLLDESTDISVEKILGVAICYFSKSKWDVVSTFLGLEQIDAGDAISIADAVKSLLLSNNLKISNLIGIGTDNANVMTGSKKSVYTELRKSVPSLKLLKCVCHSVQLAVTKSCTKVLPDNLEFLVHETYSWFSKSCSRQLNYKKVYQCINDNKNPLKIPRVCDTRWLSIESAVSRIVDQWTELKLHFELAATTEKCHKAHILNGLYKDDTNYLYLVFLKPILKEMQSLNKNFQARNGNPTQLLSDVIVAINSLKSKIIPPDHEINILEDDLENAAVPNMYLGYAFEQKIKEAQFLSQELEIRKICMEFVKELIIQLRERLPDNIEIMQLVNLFSVQNMLKVSKSKEIFKVLI